MSIPESTPAVTRWCMLIVSLVCLVPTIYAVAMVGHFETTGTAVYSSDLAGLVTERVTRAQAPKQFQQAILQNVLGGLLTGSVSAAAFYFYRRLST